MNNEKCTALVPYDNFFRTMFDVEYIESYAKKKYGSPLSIFLNIDEPLTIVCTSIIRDHLEYPPEIVIKAVHLLTNILYTK